jgi:hypothetical protein
MQIGFKETAYLPREICAFHLNFENIVVPVSFVNLTPGLLLQDLGYVQKPRTQRNETEVSCIPT